MFRNPYDVADQGSGKWRKANFHLHAGTQADPYDIEEVLTQYKKAGYELIMVSNQYVLTDTSEIAKRAGIAAFNGIEYMEQEEMLCVGLKAFAEGGVESVADQCAAQGGFTIVCHPNYLRPGWWPHKKMAETRNIAGLEVINPVIFKLQGSGLAADCWDDVLSMGRLLWGFGSDDFHTWQDFARAWTMIFCASTSLEDVRAAVLRGSLYASTGLTLGGMTLKDGVISVSVDCGKTDLGKITLSFIGENGAVLAVENGTHAVYRLAGTEKYVRAHAAAESGHQLWTQPVYDDTQFRKNI